MVPVVSFAPCALWGLDKESTSLGNFVVVVAVAAVIAVAVAEREIAIAIILNVGVC